MLRSIIDHSFKSEKNVYGALIDLSKAFDKIHRNNIWTKLRNRGVPAKITELIKELYKNQQTKFIING